MYAEIGRNTLDPQNVPSLDALKQLQLILARQPGYKGYIAVESENAQRVFVRLWESEAAAQGANESDELKVFRAKYICPAITQNEPIGRGDVLHFNMSSEINVPTE